MIHKRIREKSQTITRAETIDRTIKTYILKNTQEYMLFLENNKQRRALLADEKLGIVKEDKHSSDPMRVAFSIPKKLYSALETLMANSGNKFLETKNERIWFAKHYPQFLIPEKY